MHLLHTSELKPVTVSVNGHRMLRFAPDERRGDEWTTNTLFTAEEERFKRFELRSLYERLRIEWMRTDDSNTQWYTNTVAHTIPSDHWQWEDNQVKAYRVELETFAIGGVAMSIGLMLYAVRGAGLVAAMLTSLPAWSSLDPLVVLAKDKNRKHNWEANGETEVEDDEHAVRAVIDEDPYDTSIRDSSISDSRSH